MKELILVKNRKARHDYEILETYEAGISLMGTEVKSLRSHHASLNEAYIQFKEGELYLINASISPYAHGNIHNHEEKRHRKLLLHKKELNKLQKAIQEKGMALIPLSLYFKKNRIKLEFGVGKGKKLYDKREALKKKSEEKSIQRLLRS